MTGLLWRRGSDNPKKGMGGRLLKEFKKLVRDKKYDEALRCGKNYIRQIGDHNHDLFFTMGAIYYTQKRYGQSLEYLDRALEIGSYDTEALLLKARAHMILGQKTKAEQSCRKIQEIDPGHEEAMSILDSMKRPKGR